ncbi:hypothetical protein [Pseudotabrizicola alkalilacus]|uniref:Rap1a immunity protein domain-containing protein n=1 Tax=Pseudotabrizicola alkalilacus TaxID=2305252 RepID=A0A411Z7W6_9RHOB|nr:hypothetical protein [Pseudotabrizicola alkalilacus]RGP39248.1 hypothetical protein D1012_03870 [Pseudotabrizicola alkalilacus]
MTVVKAGLAVAACLILPAAAVGQSLGGTADWVARKCSLYTEAWVALTAGQGGAGIGPAFFARHEAFLVSGCTARAEVCPVSPEEFALADKLSLMAVAEGMAGSFLPFACR